MAINPLQGRFSCGDLAVAFIERDACDCALKAVEHVQKADPQSTRLFARLRAALETGEDAKHAAAAVQALFDGYMFRQDGKPERAAEAFSTATKEDPELAVAFAELGVTLAESGDVPRAAAALRKACEMDPVYAAMLGDLAAALGTPDGAEAELAAVCKYQIGQAHLTEGDFASAAADFREALVLHPSYAAAYSDLGFTLTQMGDFDGAIKALRKHNELNPSHPGAHANLALALLAKDDGDGALESMRSAFALDSQMAAAFGPLVKVMLEDKDYAAARAEIDRLRQSGTTVPGPIVMYLEGQDSRE